MISLFYPGQSLKHQLYPLKYTFSLLSTTHSTSQQVPSLILPICCRPFQVFPPQTRRTFKVFSDNVTVVVHLFPIRCNLPGQLGKFSFIFILHFFPFLSLSSSLSVSFLLGTQFTLQLAFFFSSQTVSNVIICYWLHWVGDKI